MIGYYVHHVGHGHVHRGTAVAQALVALTGEPVTGFSTLPAPPGWPGPWVQLEPDDGDVGPVDRTARDRLHWAPLGHRGLRSRMAEIASWLRHVSPRVFVVDVSVEVAVLVRLHGIPVVTVVQPGERGDDAHQLGFDLADALVGCWPPEATTMLRGVPPYVRGRVQPVGAVSRFAVAAAREASTGPRRVVLLSGSGGSVLDQDGLDAARAQTPGWQWQILDPRLGEWVEEPYAELLAADVVITHAGQNALAEVAASRTPALVVPQPRPHEEQRTTADVLARGPWPAVVTDEWPGHDWSGLLERAAALPGEDWAGWCDGHGADRFAAVVASVALPSS